MAHGEPLWSMHHHSRGLLQLDTRKTTRARDAINITATVMGSAHSVRARSESCPLCACNLYDGQRATAAPTETTFSPPPPSVVFRLCLI
eukprot:6197265-Pleurochrysis_carterae.AAC.4